MHISDFDYELPPELIARHPAVPRDAARMMVLDNKPGPIQDALFSDLPNILLPSDVLVLNDTRVIRARARARLLRKNGTVRQIEVFFAEPAGTDNPSAWQVLCKPGRRIRAGDRAVFGSGPDEIVGTFLEGMGSDLHVLELQDAEEVIAHYGEMPLPPYLERPVTSTDEVDYQTVFGSRPGAVAAPTAGLHFTDNILAAIRARGIEIAHVTLHVGIGTFLPVRSEQPELHTLRPERYEVTPQAAASLQRAMREGRRIVGVGTTTTRTLEYLMQQFGEIRAGSGQTDLYVLPGFEFRVVDALLTNFHLPRSTLLMLVAALAGRDNVLRAYRHAVQQGYRFYSYGDCMLVSRM